MIVMAIQTLYVTLQGHSHQHFLVTESPLWLSWLWFLVLSLSGRDTVQVKKETRLYHIQNWQMTNPAALLRSLLTEAGMSIQACVASTINVLAQVFPFRKMGEIFKIPGKRYNINFHFTSWSKCVVVQVPFSQDFIPDACSEIESTVLWKRKYFHILPVFLVEYGGIWALFSFADIYFIF